MSSLFKNVLAAATPIKQKQRRKATHRVNRARSRYEHLKWAFPDPDEWNKIDVVTYYQVLMKSKFGFLPPSGLPANAGVASMLLEAFRNMQNVKLAIQIFITRLDKPKDMRFMIWRDTVIEVKDHWDEVLSPKVMDKRVLDIL